MLTTNVYVCFRLLHELWTHPAQAAAAANAILPAQSVMLKPTSLSPVLFLTSSLFAFVVDASVQQPQVHTGAVLARIFFPVFFQAQAYGQ